MNKQSLSHFKHIRTQVACLLALGAACIPAGAMAQSLWHDGLSHPMYADKRATGMGDIITIAVQESTTASKGNKTSTSKQSALDASITSFLYSPGASSLLTKAGKLPAMKFDSKNSFDGGGTVNNSESIVAYVAATVIDVLPNGNLVIEGKRETAFSGEKQTIVLRGVVRVDDIAANNTVLSYKIADASIHIVNKGAVSDNQRRGWFTWVWDKLTPF
jgi:flagellar L-ring protein precursor FlgH